MEQLLERRGSRRRRRPPVLRLLLCALAVGGGLVRWLREYYGLEAGQIIRHYDVTGKECPRYYVQHPEAWAQFLLDVQE